MARHFLDNSTAHQLPTGVPYIGMGSSYFAPLAFKYMGLDVYPEIAAEFFNYVADGQSLLPQGVLLSQSGKSTEVLWCTQLFKQFTAITNNAHSPLCLSPAANQIIPLLAGEEAYSSSKTYINTLLALFKGFGMEMRPMVKLLEDQLDAYEELGRIMAEAVYQLLTTEEISGLYITGSGPNVATAMQAGLILSESTKLNFTGLSMAQYDHGPKETAANSIVIQVLSTGKAYDRTVKLSDTIRKAGAHVFTVEEPLAGEKESVLPNIIPFNFMAYYLSQLLNVADTFLVGGKVTEVI